MATIMRFHGEPATNAIVDLAGQIAASSDEGTTDFLPKPLVNAEFDTDMNDVPKTVTLYLKADDNDAVWYIAFTMEDFEKMKEMLSLTNK